MSLGKRISIILAIINILFLLIFALGTIFTIEKYNQTIESSTLEKPFLISLIFGLPKIALVVVFMLLISGAFFKEKIKSIKATLLINILLLVASLFYAIVFYSLTTQYLQDLILYKTKN